MADDEKATGASNVQKVMETVDSGVAEMEQDGRRARAPNLRDADHVASRGDTSEKMAKPGSFGIKLGVFKSGGAA